MTRLLYAVIAGTGGQSKQEEDADLRIEQSLLDCNDDKRQIVYDTSFYSSKRGIVFASRLKQQRLQDCSKKTKNVFVLRRKRRKLLDFYSKKRRTVFASRLKQQRPLDRSIKRMIVFALRLKRQKLNDCSKKRNYAFVLRRKRRKLLYFYSIIYWFATTRRKSVSIHKG